MKAVILLSKTFFKGHPKAGQETKFACKVLNELYADRHLIPVDFDNYAPNYKRHTCRINYEYWKKKIDRLKAEGGVLSVREWNEKPYRSPQEIIVDIPAENIDVQKIRIVLCNDKSLLTSVDGKPLFSEFVAEKDGLSLEDFKAWFLPAFKKGKTDVLDIAVIHFTKFRY
jgi:hypothetical protein